MSNNHGLSSGRSLIGEKKFRDLRYYLKPKSRGRGGPVTVTDAQGNVKEVLDPNERTGSPFLKRHPFTGRIVHKKQAAS